MKLWKENHYPEDIPKVWNQIIFECSPCEPDGNPLFGGPKSIHWFWRLANKCIDDRALFLAENMLSQWPGPREENGTRIGVNWVITKITVEKPEGQIDEGWTDQWTDTTSISLTDSFHMDNNFSIIRLMKLNLPFHDFSTLRWCR